MTQALEKINPQTGEIIEAEATDLVVARQPNEVLEQARVVALALQERISKKAKPVKFNGETYFEFEDWQVLANFYGITAKVTETKYVEYGNVKGFEARAVAIKVSTGLEVSGAEAMCLNDEPNWKSKPLFQLKSMAQTRACSKALRNVLAWVVVLAGYKPTPAEEMTGLIQEKASIQPPQRKSQAQPIKLDSLDQINDYMSGGLPSFDSDEQSQDENAVCQFGKNKGVAWKDMTDNQLKWYKETFEKDLADPEKERFHAKTQARLNAVLLAIEDREGM